LAVHEPIVQAMAMYQAIFYGLLYLFMIEVPVIYTERTPAFSGSSGRMIERLCTGYGQSLGISGLHYIALGMGCAPFVAILDRL
jgi:hypothetical protein